MEDRRLRKREILRGKKNFDEVFQRGKVLRGKYVNIYFLEGQDTKVGFCVSKAFKKAVERNRVKRLLREIYRNEKDPFKNKWTVIFAKKSDKLPSFWELREDVLTTMGKCEGSLNS